MKNRILSLVLTLSLALALVPAAAPPYCSNPNPTPFFIGDVFGFVVAIGVL